MPNHSLCNDVKLNLFLIIYSAMSKKRLDVIYLSTMKIGGAVSGSNYVN